MFYDQPLNNRALNEKRNESKRISKSKLKRIHTRRLNFSDHDVQFSSAKYNFSDKRKINEPKYRNQNTAE